MLALSVGTLLGRRWQDGEGVLESLTLQTLVAAVAFTLVATARSTLAPPADINFWWSVLLGGVPVLVRRLRGLPAGAAPQRRDPGQRPALPHAAHHDAVGLS